MSNDKSNELPHAIQATHDKCAEGTNSLFRHSLTIAASAERVWSIWMDVNNWPSWDIELKHAQSEAQLAKGVVGTLTPKRGPRTKFKVVAFEPNRSYSFVTSLPLAKLTITRVLKPTATGVTFMHVVKFSGLAGGLFARMFGPVFRTALPVAMCRIAAQATGSGEHDE